MSEDDVGGINVTFLYDADDGDLVLLTDGSLAHVLPLAG